MTAEEVAAAIRSGEMVCSVYSPRVIFLFSTFTYRYMILTVRMLVDPISLTTISRSVNS